MQLSYFDHCFPAFDFGGGAEMFMCLHEMKHPTDTDSMVALSDTFAKMLSDFTLWLTPCHPQ